MRETLCVTLCELRFFLLVANTVHASTQETFFFGVWEENAMPPVCANLCNRWGCAALRHGIQNSMEAILACWPAVCRDWVAISSEQASWRGVAYRPKNPFGGGGAVHNTPSLVSEYYRKSLDVLLSMGYACFKPCVLVALGLTRGIDLHKGVIARNTATPYKEIYGKSPVCGPSLWLDGVKRGRSRRSKRLSKPDYSRFDVLGGLPVRWKHR